jgi:hypothetical protein
MTFEEYNNQSEPIKQPLFSVKIPKTNYNISILNQVFVKFPKCIRRYIKDKNGNLFTIDEDGNKQNTTCFCLEL